MNTHHILNQLWYRKSFLSFLLLPFSYLYRAIFKLRACCYRYGIFSITKFPVPIVVVGNLTVGGTGKTPLVIFLVEYCRQQGWRPGVVSRGYGAKPSKTPQAVTSSSNPHLVGDEAIVVWQRCQCPVVVAKNRVAAVEYLLQKSDCNIVISDDGLQHIALSRDLEIVVVDSERRFGNQRCLPAGPLREPLTRLKKVNFIVINGDKKFLENAYSMKIIPKKLVNLVDATQEVTADYFQGKPVQAVAGIGNPQRFFDTLQNLKIDAELLAYPDHYSFRNSDFTKDKNAIIIMTEKDAVKCRKFVDSRFWYLPINAELNEEFLNKFQLFLTTFS